MTYLPTFQSKVMQWMMSCFGPEISADKVERNHRFLEEALELVQANGCMQSEAHQLVDYVYNRPQGEINQEAGGVMVTLAALCEASNISMHDAGDTELARIWQKIHTIREKQATKPKHSPLPESSLRPDQAGADWRETRGILKPFVQSTPPDERIEQKETDLIRAKIMEIMQDCWNDWCADTGCFPCDFKISRGPRLEFNAGSWAGNVADYIILKIHQKKEHRSSAEEALSHAYYLITGRSPQWSNLFGYEQALEDINDAQISLRKAARALSRRQNQEGG